MRFRSTSQEQASSSPRAAGLPDGPNATRSRGIGRKIVLLALGLVAAAYVAARYLGRSTDVPSSVHDLQDRVPSAEAVREQTTDAVPGDFQEIPIGERSDEEADAETDEADPTTETADDAAAEGGDAAADDTVGGDIDDQETNVDMTDGERSAAEITERADEDVPEPGEMAVDEDVADELVDTDEADAAEDDTAEDDSE